MIFPHKAAPLPGERIQVCDGIQWFYIPLPFALDHVNCWLLGEPGDNLLIDTGVDNESTRALWQDALSANNQWPSQILVTHFHPDHVGLAGWFAKNGTEPTYGSAVELSIASALQQVPDEDYAESYARWYAQNGLPDATVASVRSGENHYGRKVHSLPDKQQWTFLADGDELMLGGRQYRVLTGQGHSPDMIMLFRDDDHVLIAADQVLPTISPNVSIMPHLRTQNPLQNFLDTLGKLESLPDDTLVLPSHGLPFTGLKGRLQVLREHHELRLQQVLEACEKPVNAFELFPMLYKRELDPQQTVFALGESLAHLHFLEHQGRIRRLESDSVIRFST